jgi:hypothetical protein
MALPPSAALALKPPAIMASAVVDGFTVNIRALPRKDTLPVPHRTTGTVMTLIGSDGNYGFDPFYEIPNLAGVSPYLSLQPGATARFLLKKASYSVTFFWGTPDTDQYIRLFDGSNRLIGTLQGADFQTAFGFSEYNRPFPIGQEDTTQIVSVIPIKRVELVEESANICCFEFSNVTAP